LGRWWLFVKEGFLLLRRNRTAWFIVQCMMVIAVGATGIITEVALHIDAIEAKVIQGFTLEVFLNVPADKGLSRDIETRLAELPDVEKVRFVSPDEAAQRFSKSMGVDLRGTLEVNPFPPSFQVSCNPACPAENLDSLATKIATWEGVDEVVYPRDLIHLLTALRNKINTTGLAIAIGIACLAFALTTVLLRLSIHSERDKIQVMSLLGASQAMVRIPFLLAGIILGAVGGVIAALLVAAVSYMAQSYFQIDIDQGLINYILMIAGGMVWGLMASAVAVLWGIRSA
jgi:cell division transport system permease protein